MLNHFAWIFRCRSSKTCRKTESRKSPMWWTRTTMRPATTSSGREKRWVGSWNVGDVWKINFSGRHLLHHQFGSSEGHSTDRGWNGTEGDQDAQSGNFNFTFIGILKICQFSVSKFLVNKLRNFRKSFIFLNWTFTNAFRGISSGSVLCWVKRSERQTSSLWRLESKSSRWIG